MVDYMDDETWEAMLKRIEDEEESEIMVGNGRSQNVQAPPPMKILSVEESIERLRLNKWRIGEDGKLWEQTFGAVQVLTPIETLLGSAPVLLDIDKTKLPPLPCIRYLYETLFKLKTQEVWVWFAQSRTDKSFKWFLPIQTGTGGSVTNRDADSLTAAFNATHRFVGTIHTHPGEWCHPSDTDKTTWAKPEFSGLHYILGRKDNYTLNAAVRGRTWTYPEATLPTDQFEVELIIQDGKTLEEALLVPQTTYVGYGRNTHVIDSDIKLVPVFLFDIEEVRASMSKKAEKSLFEKKAETEGFPRLVADVPEEEISPLEGTSEDAVASMCDRNEALEMLSDEIVEEGGLWVDLEKDNESFVVSVVDGRIFIFRQEDEPEELTEESEAVLAELLMRAKTLTVTKGGRCALS